MATRESRGTASTNRNGRTEVQAVLEENRRTVAAVEERSRERRAALGRARMYLDQVRRSLRRGSHS